MHSRIIRLVAFSGIAALWLGHSIALAGTVTGTATYKERIAVPQDAVLDVVLLDVSLADVPAAVLASQRYALNSVPASFELTYDDALIDEAMRYVVRASVYQGRRLVFTTDTANPVLTHGAGDAVDLIMIQVAGQAGAMLENTTWRAVEINGQSIDSDKRPEIAFGESGQFGGNGGCNRFSGQMDITASTMSFPDNMAATLMACPPPLDEMEREFLATLPRVEGYSVEPDKLILVDGQGAPVLRFERIK